MAQKPTGGILRQMQRGARRVLRQLLTTADNVINYIGRVIRPRVASTFSSPTNDWSRPNYPFWRRAYYCRADGLELSGLFIKPIVNKIAAWVMGRPPQWKTPNPAAAEALNEWWVAHHADILRAYRAALRQGDQFVVINADLSLTLVKPDFVDPIVGDDDYGSIIGWRITEVLSHPTETTRRMVRIDEYYADRRIRRIEIDGIAQSERTFRNVIGRVPVVHIANRPDDGETFGHPEPEPLANLLHRYGTVLEAAIDGNVLQGRPTPVANFATVGDLNKFWEIYGTERTVELPDGTTETTPYLDLDLSQLLTMSGGSFTYQSPGAFAGDVEIILGLLFYLVLEHAEIPEFVMGNAIASSKASADAQMPIWEQFVEMRRGDITGWLTDIAVVVLAYMRYLRPGSVALSDRPALQWREISSDGRLTLDTITWALQNGLIDDRTALMLAPVPFADIDELLAAAQRQRDERRAQAAAIAQPAAAENGGDANDDGGGQNSGTDNADDAQATEYTNGSRNGVHGPKMGDFMRPAEVAAVINAASRIVAKGE